MAQPTSLIIFSTIQNIIVVRFAFVLHSSCAQGQSVAGARSKSQGDKKDRTVGMGGHTESSSVTERTKPTPVDPMVDTSHLSCVLSLTDSVFCPGVFLLLPSLSLKFRCSKYGILCGG